MSDEDLKYKLFCNLRLARTNALRSIPWTLCHEPRAAILVFRTWRHLRVAERTLWAEITDATIEEARLIEEALRHAAP